MIFEAFRYGGPHLDLRGSFGRTFAPDITTVIRNELKGEIDFLPGREFDPENLSLPNSDAIKGNIRLTLFHMKFPFEEDSDSFCPKSLPIICYDNRKPENRTDVSIRDPQSISTEKLQLPLFVSPSRPDVNLIIKKDRDDNMLFYRWPYGSVYQQSFGVQGYYESGLVVVLNDGPDDRTCVSLTAVQLPLDWRETMTLKTTGAQKETIPVSPTERIKRSPQEEIIYQAGLLIQNPPKEIKSSKNAENETVFLQGNIELIINTHDPDRPILRLVANVRNPSPRAIVDVLNIMSVERHGSKDIDINITAKSDREPKKKYFVNFGQNSPHGNLHYHYDPFPETDKEAGALKEAIPFLFENLPHDADTQKTALSLIKNIKEGKLETAEISRKRPEQIIRGRTDSILLRNSFDTRNVRSLDIPTVVVKNRQAMDILQRFVHLPPGSKLQRAPIIVVSPPNLTKDGGNITIEAQDGKLIVKLSNLIDGLKYPLHEMHLRISDPEGVIGSSKFFDVEATDPHVRKGEERYLLIVTDGKRNLAAAFDLPESTVSTVINRS